ncbi:DUF4145 domain-containing protein [Caldibacillus debilis]|uniref:DUF4145 domain-containing protein n=1 Tax=Caldibacillus debilis GB1 TaxID=1339248 RepID=A0A420VIA6_9BACI|nr:DUF4145 domain-containing protein [Caldibacillus debilis]RKO63246.1 Protein of unknown function (DUF4145) [Caldibacillus debilis GB1]
MKRIERLEGYWDNVSTYNLGISFRCGYCGINSGPSHYYFLKGSYVKAYIYICPSCNRPTYINKDYDEQVPGPFFGDEVEFLPDEVESLYDEARKCFTVGAYTSSVLACRKILMNSSVDKGAEPGKKFVEYVDFLEENHFIPPNSRDWVDMIRKKGNEATHEIPSISKEDAMQMLEFTELLLKHIYELPGKMEKYKNGDNN